MSEQTGEPRFTPRQIEILAAATRIFSQYGYRGGTIARIAAEAELSQPGLIHHFPSKDAILMAVVEQRDEEDREVVNAAYRISSNVIEALTQVLHKNALDPDLMRLFTVLSTEALNADHPAHEFFAHRYARVIANTATAVRSNQAAGVVRDDLDPEDVARLLVAAADGLRYQALITDEPIEHWRRFGVLEKILSPAARQPEEDELSEAGR